MIIDPYQFRAVQIKQIIREAKNANSILFTPPANYKFLPGQHTIVRITLPNGIKLMRQYSFSAPMSNNELRLTIVKKNDGQVSTWFTDIAKIGDKLEISQPFTGPLVQKIPRGEICLIAGGSGIAPIMAWVRNIRKQDKKFTLLYSTKSYERCFSDELTPLPGERIFLRLTDEHQRFSKNEIVDVLTKNMTVFICGSRPFSLAMRAYCKEIVPSDHIFVEAFSL